MRTRAENARDMLQHQMRMHRHQGKTFRTGMRRALDHVLNGAPEGRAYLNRRDLQRLFDQGYAAGLTAGRHYLARLEQIKAEVRAAGGNVPAEDAPDDAWWEASIALIPFHKIFPPRVAASA